MAASADDGEEHLRRARALADAGRFDDAYALIEGQAERELSPAARALKAQLRQSLERLLAERFPSHDVVMRRREGGDLRAYPLCARDVFLLGLFRDEIPLRDALALSPLDEVDNLRTLAKLIDLGLVGPGRA